MGGSKAVMGKITDVEVIIIIILWNLTIDIICITKMLPKGANLDRIQKKKRKRKEI